MKKIISSVTFALCFVFVVLLLMFLRYPNNSANRLRKDIGTVEELKVFPLPNNGENPLVSIRDVGTIQKFLGSIEFGRVSPRRVVIVKMPGILEFVTTGTTTQRMQWIECGWGYLRADNDLLTGDVELTEASSQKLADWLTKQGIEVPERSPPPKLIKSK